ncbi:unnamed protein product [Pieris brassicae]|uniref:Uncharacterized protein n=1 Tax=Pieris brassicae TaxID=7116 RepID=A0A9P0XAR1_PIEBR|nr:unnamed protein product [Pieris brassicae]
MSLLPWCKRGAEVPGRQGLKDVVRTSLKCVRVICGPSNCENKDIYGRVKGAIVERSYIDKHPALAASGECIRWLHRHRSHTLRGAPRACLLVRGDGHVTAAARRHWAAARRPRERRAARVASRGVTPGALEPRGPPSDMSRLETLLEAARFIELQELRLQAGKCATVPHLDGGSPETARIPQLRS